MRRRKAVIAGVCIAAATAGVVPAWPRLTARVALSDQGDRRQLIARRASAERSGDAVRASLVNAQLSHEALVRAQAVHDAWMTRRDPSTGLFPEYPRRTRWNYHNVAADFFCYEYAMGQRIHGTSLPLLRASLASERALTAAHGFCSPLDTRTGLPLDSTPFARLFGASEYLKDGLVALYEATGDADVLSRMREVADGIMLASTEPSKFGLIPSRDTELNGDILQAFSRLACITGDARYADFVGRLGDAVALQMLAGSGGLPVKEYDYAADRCVNDTVQLRDHGNEAAVGLSEVFALAVSRSHEPAWKERADRWAEPLAAMFEALLSSGTRADGLLVDTIDRSTRKPTSDRACDNWGYLAAGVILFTEAQSLRGALSAARLDALLAAVDRVALAVTMTDGLEWEGNHFDGYADSIESAIYVASRRPEVRTQLLAWADDQIGLMFAHQRRDGLVCDGYLDGNFIRTALQYADVRSGGFRLEPWSSGTRVGLSAIDNGEPVVVVVAGWRGYRGRLVADTPRHRTRMRLPWDWTRINCWPEWIVAEESDAGAALNLASGERRVFTLKELGAHASRLP